MIRKSITQAPRYSRLLIESLAKLGPCEAEHAFHPSRKWRFDFAWVQYGIALEVEGGVWTRGRHTRGTGALADMDKYNAAAAMGWIVFRIDPKRVYSPNLYAQISQAAIGRCFGDVK